MPISRLSHVIFNLSVSQIVNREIRVLYLNPSAANIIVRIIHRPKPKFSDIRDIERRHKNLDPLQVHATRPTFFPGEDIAKNLDQLFGDQAGLVLLDVLGLREKRIGLREDVYEAEVLALDVAVDA